jgi:hypothetical protein
MTHLLDAAKMHFNPSRRPRRQTRPAVEILEDRLAPAAQAIGFTIDPASSTLSLSGTLVTPLVSQSVAPQGAGSLTTSFSGSINTLVDFAASSLLFREAGTSVDAAVSGNWSPLQGGGAGAAPSDYGGQFNAIVDTVFVAVHNMVGTFSTAAPLSLTGIGATSNFDSTQQLRFTSGTVDYFEPGILGSIIGAGSINLANLTAVNSASDGSLEDLGGGNYRLTVPILVSIETDLAAGYTVTLTMQGSLVANASVPVVDLNGPAGGNDFVATFTEDSAPVAVVAAAATITNAAAGHLSGARMVLTNHPDGAAESLAINVGASGLISSGYDSATGVLTLSGDASLAVYESVLRTVTYANASQNPSTANRVIEITVTDALNPASDSLVRQSTVGVGAVNDAPVNHVPGPLVLNHVGTIHFGAGAFSVADPDAGAADLQMTLSASAGTLQLDSTAGLIATGGGTGTLTLTGNRDALNAALVTLSYTPPVGFVGAAALTMTTNDQGSAGVGAAGTDTDIVPVAVTNLRPTRLAAFARGIPYTALAGKPLTVAVRKGLARAFRDFNFDPFTVAVLKAPPAYLGTVVVRPDGSFTFRAKPAAKGARVIFRVRAFDGAAFSDPLIVTMIVV